MFIGILLNNYFIMNSDCSDNNNPCQNGGVCNEGQDPLCNCDALPDWQGDNCEVAVGNILQS